MKKGMRLWDYFELDRLGTSWKTETLAGVTTFLTMACIIVVNPADTLRRRDTSGAFHGGHGAQHF